MKTRNRQQHRVHCGGVTIVADTLPSKPAKKLTGDEELRAAGFVIHARPSGAEPVWRRDGLNYPQSQARKLARRSFPKSTTGGA